MQSLQQNITAPYQCSCDSETLLQARGQKQSSARRRHISHLRRKGLGQSCSTAQHSCDLNQDRAAGARRTVAPGHARRRSYRAAVRQPHRRQTGQTGADARLWRERSRGGRTAGAMLLVLLLMLLECLPIDECSGICAARQRRQQVPGDRLQIGEWIDDAVCRAGAVLADAPPG